MNRIPLALQTAYADLLEKLLDEQIRGVSARRGGFISKIIKGRTYWYHQTLSPGGERRQHYLGPETPDLLSRIQTNRELLETARARRDIVRSLTRGQTMAAPPARVGKVLEALAEAGVFRLRGVLVGTVAFGCYGPMLGVRLQSSSLMTSDIDIAQFRSISIAVDEQIPPVLDALRAVEPSFQPVTLPFHAHQPVSYISAAKDTLKVEFLTPMRGPVEDAPGHLPALQTSAQPLRFLDYLIYGERTAAILHGSGVLVNVPHPARYAWHKCIVAERRIETEKTRKDLLQAQTLFDALCTDHPHDVTDMFDELAGPGRVRWQEIALDGLAKIDPAVRTRVLALIDPAP